MKVFREQPSKLIACIFLFLFCSFQFFSQSISGVVNNYAEVTAIAVNSVEVADASAFQIGDKVLIIQMKGAAITTGNVPSFGTITNQNSAGAFEFAIVSAVNNLTVSFQNNLCHNFDVSGSVQLVRISVHNDVVISGQVTADPWNGSTGGVVVIESSNSITLNADINVMGSGFRGGQISVGSFSCGDPNWANMNGGQKGEGIADAPNNEGENRAPLANGGGGSNTGNPGAGGGANGGSGGMGGDEWYGSCALNASIGIGGYALDYSGDKAFLGGGGGGGYKDNGLNCTAGANGGGIVFLLAPTINGNGFSVDASGSNVFGNTDSEGAGGGGAGGCVYIDAQAISSQLNVNVSGGSGGDILSTLWQSACHGPGGGGGGGTVVMSFANIPALLNVNNSGGNSGTVLHTGPACAGTPHGATNGDNGQLLFDYIASIALDLGPDQTVCDGDLVTLTVPSGFTDQLWSTGSTSPTISLNSEGEYYLDAINSNGCLLSDTFNLYVVSAVVTSQIDSSCFDVGYNFNGTMIYNSGFYSDTLSNINGCDSIVELEFTAVDLPIFSLVDTAVCYGDSVLLSPIGNFSFEWNPLNGDLDSNGSLWISATENQNYIVTATGPYNCTSEESLQLTVNALPIIDLYATLTEICADETIDLSVTGGANYIWTGYGIENQTSENQTVTLDSSQTYYVTGETDFGCIDSNSINILVNELPELSITPLQEICFGDVTEIEVSGGNYYEWIDASGVVGINGSQAIVSPPETSLYQVVGFNNLNCFDTITTAIEVFPIPNAEFSANPMLMTSDSPFVTLNNTSTNNLVSIWNYGDGIQEENNTVNYEYQYPYVEGNYFIQLLVISEDGCTDSSQVLIQIKGGELFYIPNAFTPDGDEFNNVFTPVFTTGFDPANYVFTIYNRWGETVFVSNQHDEGWDGTYSNSACSDGIYTYVIKYKNPDLDEYQIVSGHLNLLR